MRKDELRINMFWAIITTALGGILTLLVRKMFVTSLPSEYLGIGKVYTSFFNFLTLFDMSVTTTIAYRFYKAFASTKEKKTYIYNLGNYVFSRISLIMLTIGLMITPLLFFFLKETSVSSHIIIISYIFQLLSECIPYYFYSYHLVLQADGKEYVSMIIKSSVNFISNLLKVWIIINYPDFILYSLSGLILVIIEKIVFYIYVKRKYPDIAISNKLSKDEIKNENIYKESIQLIPVKVAGIINSSSITVLTTKLIGLTPISLFSNYEFLTQSFDSFFDRIRNFIRAFIGNNVHGDNENKLELFTKLTDVAFLLSTTVFSACLLLLSPIIKISIGEKFLIDDTSLLIFSLSQLFIYSDFFIQTYRDVFSNYEDDNKIILFSAIANVVISFCLYKRLGFAGILFGQLVAQIIKSIGRTKVILNNLEITSRNKYWYKKLICITISIVEVLLIKRCIPEMEGFSEIIVKIFTCILLVIFNLIFIFMKNFLKNVKIFKTMTKKKN